MTLPVFDSATASGLIKLEEGGYSAEALLNENLVRLDHGASGPYRVLDRDLATPPGSPSDEDTYIVASGATGAWSGHDDAIAIYLADAAGWTFIAPRAGMVAYVVDEVANVRHDGSGWTNREVPFKTGRMVSVTTGITAATAQTQGQQALTTEWNTVSTVANVGDVVTMPTCIAGRRCVIWNRGAKALQVFPASGDKFDGGPLNGSVIIAAGGRYAFCGIDATEWLSEADLVVRNISPTAFASTNLVGAPLLDPQNVWLSAIATSATIGTPTVQTA